MRIHLTGASGFGSNRVLANPDATLARLCAEWSENARRSHV
ncbi:MAG: hypothetical protein ACYC91_08150 [Solirubrobacteraceae bacterium]